MEVSSSTVTSTPQETIDHMLPHTATTISLSSRPDVSTSSGENGDLFHLADGLNNIVTTETGVGPNEQVRYGPALPPNFYTTETITYSKDVQDSKAVPGSCGLYNLGNTCFMNAGIQSLMSCSALVKYFCDNYTLTESNRHTLTAQFYILLCKMWSGKFSVVHPRKFKEFLGFYHSQFEDYRQHDCQEFLALLLDTLHEQLNNATSSNKRSYSTSPLPLTSSSSSSPPPSFPGTCCSAAITTTSGKESPLSSVEAPIRVDDIERSADLVATTDLNNKDSNIAVIKQDLRAVELSDLRIPPKFLEVAQPSPGGEIGQSPGYPSEGSPTSEASVLDSIVTSPSSHGDVASQKSPDHEEEDEMISSSFPALRRYTSRSNLDDVSSSDSGIIIIKPSLKRVSSGNSVTTCGAFFHSEDSNHSTVSAHSTDSEQSSAFKRLKIDTVELNRNTNNNLKDCVTSSSDCKKSGKSRRNMLGDSTVLKEAGDVMVSSNAALTCSHKDLNVIDNMVTSCQDSLCVDVKFPGPDNSDVQSQLSPGILDDFYSKETKTLNTNVLVSDLLQDITSDSEKFAKMDNRLRPPSKEINILQEAFGEEDKADKVLIGQRFGGVKDTNLYAHSSAVVVKAVKNTDPNVLNNSIDRDVMDVETKFPAGHAEVSGMDVVTMKLVGENKLNEEEKNVQMQAYSKFNTIPVRSNIRTDLIDSAADTDSMEIDEVEVESSDDDEIEVVSHSSAVECSSVPNCLRHCASSEVMMANRVWEEYKAKNDSVIVSTFQGQFRSTVVCSECSHVSVTYEPFMYLSLPIPHAMDQQISVVYISQHKPPVRYLLNLLKTDRIGTVKKKLCDMISQEDGNIIMAEVLDSHISRILDDNILLKYVNTFNRKIYAFEIISVDAGNVQAGDNLSCDQMLNNEGSPTFRHDLEVPSSSRSELPYVTDSHVSNQSFDSINVNSPSSRDTLDYMFSDSEVCEPSSRENPEYSSAYLNVDDDEGECQSTSGGPSGREPWVSGGEYSNNHRLSWNLDYDEDLDAVSTNNSLACSSSQANTDDNVNSNMSEFWVNKNKERTREIKFSNDDNEAASLGNICDKTIASVKTSSHLVTSQSGPAESPAKTSPAKSDKGVAKGSSVTTSTTVTTTISVCNNQPQISSSSGGNNSQSGSSQNPSRSCPSPESFSHVPEHEATLMSVAARLGESPGSYFLHRAQNDADYGYFQDGSSDAVDTSCSYREEKPRVGCEEPAWSSSFPVHNPSTSHGDCAPACPLTDQWRSCAICLEDLLDTELLTHIMCDGVFCQNCLEMSVKHTADVSAFCCPICLQPANTYEDFVPLASASATKPKIRTLPMSIAYRHNVRDNTGADTLQLFGHPSILHMPSVMTGDSLYSLVDHIVSPLLSSYSIKLTDGQGLTCSRCTYSRHCSGCEIARDGEITLQPSDCLTVHICETLSSEQVCDSQYVHEDPSMAGLRSSEPTTIMDCFGAFTQSEILDEHNPWYCPQCERNQCAKKTMTVWRYPDNLIIHLKRFVYQDLSSTKVDTKVIFPKEGMDVRGFLSGPSSSGLVYDLYSIVCHFGGASAGHYTCYSKHPLTTQWYYNNDESVSQQGPSDSEYSSGYVLFYQRRGTDVEFTPPQDVPFFEDEQPDNMVATTSSYSSRNNGQANNMALVVFQPPATSSQADKVEEEDDYDNEQRCSPCDDESLTVHFGSSFAEPEDNFDENEAEADGVNEDDNDDDGRINVTEPDSTLDFYS